MAHAMVPEFGKWENGQDVPYTQYFEKARKGKNGRKMINPNDSQDNMTAYTDNIRPIQSPPFRNGVESDARVREGALKPRHNQQLNFPVPRDNSGRKTNIEHKRNVSSGETQKRAGRQTGGNQGLAPNKPIRSKLGPVAREDETQDKSADVPKLGEWDESNPADNGFTGIFGKLSEEKHGRSANVIAPDDVSNFSDHKRANSSSNVKFTCFSWGKR